MWMRRALLILCLCALAAPCPAHADDAWKAEEARWKRDRDRPPLQVRWRAMLRIAKQGGPEARDELLKRYTRPQEPKDHEQYLIASVLGQFFDPPEHAAPLMELARKRTKDHDAWLWFNVLRATYDGGDHKTVHAVAQNAKERPLHRAAALQVLAQKGNPDAVATLAAVLPSLEKAKGFPLMVLLESGVAVLRARRADVKDEAYQVTAHALLQRAKAREVTHRTRLVIARFLGNAFGVRRLSLDMGYWQQVVAQQTIDDQQHGTVARPRFGGIEASGTRIAYLIDMSDSMTARLPLGLAARLRDAGELLPTTLIAEVTNRFELARELLRAALSGLDEDTSFVVIPFGTEAKFLEATPGLVKTSKRSIKAAMHELDEIESKGRLWDATNLHGALRKAFLAIDKKAIKHDAHVDPKTFERGVDTIFLLSDGKPTNGDFPAWDKADPDVEVGRAEHTARRAAKENERINYWCAYRSGFTLVRDLRRLNLFRKVEIHCLALGEADRELLDLIAGVGMGTVRNIED